ncbi:hypothetical protein K458DRAFT_393124 [Lentithecium fluviatile CBS 122367]|uniref:Uncharacterized protein n=1 Tax=Lentithecium fluviatile CBS 122367 TaxID=1168545 RepID=A0A6G1IPK5_9PLEO|nr:hypothetical protein K458DRAFT_393124 [Lentithecium fluviatile CBS 122367]
MAIFLCLGAGMLLLAVWGILEAAERLASVEVQVLAAKVTAADALTRLCLPLPCSARPQLGMTPSQSRSGNRQLAAVPNPRRVVDSPNPGNAGAEGRFKAGPADDVEAAKTPSLMPPTSSLADSSAGRPSQAGLLDELTSRERSSTEESMGRRSNSDATIPNQEKPKTGICTEGRQKPARN